MTDLDLSQSIIAKSDQVNSDDLIAGPITVTISRVVKGSPEQPFDFQLVETPNRAYRPSKTMRRVIVEAWGPDATKYAGRRLTLYREPSITFGGQKVGGIRISHMSHIAGPVVLAAQVTKGKSETFTVQPLPIETPARSGDAPESEPLLDAITRQITEIAADGGAAYLKTWMAENECGTSKRALAEKFGERARNIRALMADMPATDVPA